MLDLQQDIVLIDEYLRASIAKFQSNVGEPTWVGIYSCPWSGWVSLHFDTSKNLDSNSQYCLGLSYSNDPELEFIAWRNTYSPPIDTDNANKEKNIIHDRYISLIDHTGNLISLDRDLGDTEFEYPFFRMFVTAANKIKHERSTCKYIVEILGGSHFEII